MYFLFLLFLYFFWCVCFWQGFFVGIVQLHFTTQGKENVASHWPIPTLRSGTNGRDVGDVVFSYLSLPTMIFSLGLNELGNLGHCMLVVILILPSAKYVIGWLPRR